MDGTPRILCNPHPPTEVTIGISIFPESPLSSAPNTPEQQHRKEISPASSPIMTPPDLDDPAVFYHQRQSKQQQSIGRESRKSRLRAAQAARRLPEETKTNDEEQHGEPIRRIPSLYIAKKPLDDESIPMDEQQQEEELVLGARLSVTRDGVEVNRQRSGGIVNYFPSFDEDDRQADSQAPSIDEAASPTTTVEALSEAGRRAALERESRWDRFERGRSLERMTNAPVVPRRPSSLSPLASAGIDVTQNCSPNRNERPRGSPTKPTTATTTSTTQRTLPSELCRTRGELTKPKHRQSPEPALESRSPLPDDRMVGGRRSFEPTLDLSQLPDKSRTASDDVSSSDETPLVRNGLSKFRDRQNLRKEEKQNQLRSMYGVARQQKTHPPSSEVLPQLTVDHQQLQTIGVQALMSVCDGIGSLFVTTEKQIKASTTATTASVSKHKKRSSRRSKQKGSKQEQPPVAKETDGAPRPVTKKIERTSDPIDDTVKAEAKLMVKEIDEDSDGEIPPPPPLVDEPNELDNSLMESTESYTDAGTEASFSASTEPGAEGTSPATSPHGAEEGEELSLSTSGAPGGSIVTSSTPESHEIGPKAPPSSKGLDFFSDLEATTIAAPSGSASSTPESHEIGPTVKAPTRPRGLDIFPVLETTESTEQTTLHDASVEVVEEVRANPVEQRERNEDFQENLHRGLDMFIARTEDEATVGSHNTAESQRSAEWSLASAIKNQANRDFPTYQSLSEHKKSDPDGNKESPFTDHSKATTSSLTNTERGSSFDISEPPTLRRLNGSIESIVPEFSTYGPPAKIKSDWPETFSNQETIPSDEGSKDPSMTLSPMSEFLAERLRDGRYDIQPQAHRPSCNEVFAVAECPEDLDCPSYSSESKSDNNLFESQNVAQKAAVDPVASNSLFGSSRDANEVPSNDFRKSVKTIHEEQLDDAQEQQYSGLNTDASELIQKSPSRNNSDTTTDLFNSLDQMVNDLQSIASGRFDSGDSQSAATVPSFADALQVDATSSTEDSVDTDIKRDFLPPNAGYEGLPYLISSINADPGIAKGDVMISLLNNDSCRILDAVSRCRLLRQYSDVDWLEKKSSRRQPGLSVLFDVDEDKEAGGINDLNLLEQAVSRSLKHDEFDRALELCSDINQVYHAHEPNIQDDADLLEKFQLYKATALYNMGIVHLLRGDIDEALSCHETAVELRTGCKDVTDSEYATLLNKSAACRFAAGDYVGAFTEMEEALLLAREELVSLDDYRQLAEILNNLGCLSYIGGKVDRAAMYFNESLSVHTKVTSKSMYLGSRFSSHTAILNASITKANLGFLLLVTQKPAESVSKLEESLRDQEILLFGAHVTIISTMDHLIVANLLAGRKKSASEMLRKVYNTLAEAFGHNSEQCVATRRKIFALEMKGGAADVSMKTYEAEHRPPKDDDDEPDTGSKKVKIPRRKPKTRVNSKSSRGGRKSKSRHQYQQAEC